MPRIVVLDGHALNPGDLDWRPLSQLGELEIYPRTSPQLIVERARDAAIVLTNKVPLSSATVSQLPLLRGDWSMRLRLPWRSTRAASRARHWTF